MTDVQPLDPERIAHLLATHVVKTARRDAPRAEDLAAAISEITLQTQTAGSSILTLSLIDPQWKLATSGFLRVNEDGLIDEIDVEFPEGSGSWWRICMLQIDNGIDAPNLILTFEDRIVSYLRDKWKPRGISPGTTTRAQFIKTLVDEVGRGDGLQPINFVCPSLNVEQPVATDSSSASNTVVLTPPSKAASDARRANKRRGVGHGAAVTAKGQALDANQINEVNTLLDTADGLHAGELATTALICAAIGESVIGKQPGTYVPNSKGYWGVLQGGSGTNGSAANFPDPHDTAGMATSFLLGGKGFQGGGAIKLARKGNGVQDLSPGAIATTVEGSGEAPQFYQQYMREAWAIIQAYGGVSEGSQASDVTASVPAPALSDVSQLTRGTADNPDESSWDCITRLATDVQWYAFSNANTLYYLDGPDLLAQRPAAYLRLAPTAGGQLDWLLIDGASGERSTGCVNELIGTFDNTAYVYRSTHRRKGKVVHKSRIARPQTPSEIQLGLVCEIDYLRAGDVIVIQDAGALEGRWVITDATRNCLADTHTQFTLGPPQAPTPEPQAQSDATSATTSSPSSSPSSSTAMPTPAGYYNPFAKARHLSPGRIDAGVDYTMTPGDEILCIGDSRVIGVNQNWYQSQPLLCMQFTAGPNIGEYWYIAEYIGNLPSVGSLIRGGDRLCTFGGAGSTGQQSIEIGWASPTSHIQVQTGGDRAGTAGENFARFLRSLGCPTVAIPTGTKGSTHNPVGAAGH